MHAASSLLGRVQALLLYPSVLAEDAGQALLALLQAWHAGSDAAACWQAYGRWFRALAARNQSWQDHLIERILQDDNPFSRQAQQHRWAELPEALVAAARQDLGTLQALYDCSPQQIGRWGCQADPPVAWAVANRQASFLHQRADWAAVAEELAHYYRQNGTGLPVQYQALRWQRGQLLGIAHPDPVSLDDIVGYERQKAALVQNTRALLAGQPALNVLLYGSRGSGKSSLVKGLLSAYGAQGLRLVELGKAELPALPQALEQLRGEPQTFIVFVDDLSFEADDEAFKALKAVLEGSVTAPARNVAIYATSNRRHLVREFFDERPQPRDREEVHAWDTLQEKLSFGDRFGLTLTFEPANRQTYLQIVHHLAAQAGIALEREALEARAQQWAQQHHGRSGRSARQFIDYLQAELALSGSTTDPELA